MKRSADNRTSMVTRSTGKSTIIPKNKKYSPVRKIRGSYNKIDQMVVSNEYGR